MVNVQQDAISKCGDVDGHDIVTYETQVRAKGSRTISTSAIGNYVAKFCYFCEVVECMCQHDCA
jgi:hypothetical protein